MLLRNQNCGVFAKLLMGLAIGACLVACEAVSEGADGDTGNPGTGGGTGGETGNPGTGGGTGGETGNPVTGGGTSNPSQPPVILDVIGRLNIDYYTQVGTPIASVAVRDSLAYVVGGRQLQIIDVSDPAAPAILSSVETFGDTANSAAAQDVAVAGFDAYVAHATNGLIKIDIRNSFAPVVVGSAFTDLWPLTVAISGTNAYVGGQTSGVADISVVLGPPREIPGRVQLISADGFTQFARDSAISGSLAYVAAEKGLFIVDISPPESPVVLGSVGTVVGPGQIIGQSVAASGNLAFVAGQSQTVQVIDASNSGAPVIIGDTISEGCISTSVALSHPFLVVGCLFNGPSNEDGSNPDLPELLVFDVSNPASLVLVGSAELSGFVTSVAVAGRYAYVAAQDGAAPFDQSLRIIDLTPIQGN